ncbi:MAG: hypothetical protein UV60_C0015G0014 [Parcubacteria group bacterium GW2011_GWA2_43_11]|nr:MAG: hypothetical protein UV60_C0015G0014 [Parcubacteria group bacterium GW2011_GWA2_43_11]
MTQGKKTDKESLSKPQQEESKEDEVQRYTFPLSPERREKIAKVFRRRVNTTGVPQDPITTDGW